MATIVGVHGINQQLKGPAVLRDEWWPSLKDGMTAAKGTLSDDALVCAFYGGLFRAAETQRSGAEPAYRPVDVQDAFEKELLQRWWEEAAREEPARVVSPQATVRGTPALVQSGLRALSRSTFFTGMAERALIGSLKQVRRYMREPAIRGTAQEAVDAVVSDDTRVLVAHSLGTVVAYEALHR